jgi:hypothetical protein
MNDMTGVTSMRLRTIMNRSSRFVEALSNIMKKVHDTQESIVQNTKG